MVYLYLAAAIAAEVVATTALKASAEFTRLLPTVIVVAGYVTAFYLLSLVLRSMSVGVAYALWSGFGIVLVTLLGALLYREVPDGPAIAGMALIIAGAAVINLYSASVRV